MTKIKKKCSKASHQKENSVVSIAGKNRKKVKKKRSRRKLRFCDLPSEILERVLGNVNTWRWNGIRATCTQLRDICDTALMHEFKTDIQKYKEIDKNGYAFIALKVTHQATWRYIKAGYCPLFLGKMLSLIRNDSLEEHAIKEFLLKFYKIVEDSSGGPFSQTSRLLYVITFLGFLNDCKNAVLVSSTDNCNDFCQLIYRLDGSRLWKRCLMEPQDGYPPLKRCLENPSQVLNYSITRNEILVIMADIMTFVEIEGSFNQIWLGEETTDDHYAYGHNKNPGAPKRKTFFTFNISGSPKILSFIKNVTSEEHWDYLPKDEFNVNLRICSEKSNIWGYCEDLQLEIGPYCGDED